VILIPLPSPRWKKHHPSGQSLKVRTDVPTQQYNTESTLSNKNDFLNRPKTKELALKQGKNLKELTTLYKERLRPHKVKQSII
jgi:hypothetical protein